MDTKNTNPAATVPQIKDGDGLFLRGLVVAIEKSERQWENERYSQVKATIVDGKNTFFYIANDKRDPLPELKPFTRAAVRVDWASKEKGVMTVRGEVSIR